MDPANKPSALSSPHLAARTHADAHSRRVRRGAKSKTQSGATLTINIKSTVQSERGHARTPRCRPSTKRTPRTQRARACTAGTSRALGRAAYLSYGTIRGGASAQSPSTAECSVLTPRDTEAGLQAAGTRRLRPVTRPLDPSTRSPGRRRRRTTTTTPPPLRTRRCSVHVIAGRRGVRRRRRHTPAAHSSRRRHTLRRRSSYTQPRA